MDENEVNLEKEPEAAPELEIQQEPETEPQSIVEQASEIEQKVEVAPRISRPVRRPRPPQPSISTEFLWFALPLVFVLGLGTGWLLWGKVPAASEEVTRYTVAEAGNPAIGPADAKVTIIEFSDYQCPYCKRWYDTVHTRLMADYEGRIRFVYRDLPLSSIHPEAQGAAEAADCAGEQNVYWQYHDALFGAKYGLGTQAYTQYATELGLNVDAFNTCVAERRYQSEVEDDAQIGASLGINGTPTFFVNGLKLVGAQPYEVFQQIIDKELAEAAKN